AKILDLRLPRSTRLSYKEMSDLLLEKIKEDIWKWFYCKHKCSLEEGLTLVENDKDIEKMFEVASYYGTIDLSHEKAKKNVDTMSFEELVAWEKEEAESSFVLRSPHVWKNLKDMGNGKGKVLLDDFEVVGKDKEYIRKLDDDVSEGKDFKMLSWVKALEYINDNGEIGGGCFGDIKSYLKKGKLEKVVAIITSCKPNMLGDMNVTLKDPSGTIPGIIHHKVLLNDDVAKAIKVGSAIILQNVYVFCPKSGEFYLNITIRNLVQIFQNVTVMEDANGASSSNISFQE
ncbi:copia protein, partial [Tanacetum coccineum]